MAQHSIWLSMHTENAWGLVGVYTLQYSTEQYSSNGSPSSLQLPLPQPKPEHRARLCAQYVQSGLVMSSGGYWYVHQIHS